MKGSTLVNIPRSNTDTFYRYKMPIIEVKIEGKGNGIRTVVPNMEKIMKALDRPMDYGAKFIGFELGTKTKCDSTHHNCVFAGKHSEETLSLCLDKFIDMYVLCIKCKNPETIFNIKKNSIESKCKACGKTFKIDPTHKLSNFIMKNEVNKKPVVEVVKKTSPKKAKVEKIVDDNDNEKWSLDTSQNAVASRKQQLMNIDDKTELVSNAFPIVNLLKYISSEPTEDDFVDELLKLRNTQGWSETVLIKYIFATLFSDGDIKYNFFKKVIYLEYFVNTTKDMMVVLMCVEKFLEEHNEHVTIVSDILCGLYESYVIDEDGIFKWYDSKSKSVSEELSRTIRENAKSFVEWLENAEEVSCEDDDV
jgi:translation initiation factor 2 beta subunit (eIF-2beta)/eIF-5